MRSIFKILKWRQWDSAVEARIFNENTHNGHSIQVKTSSQVDRRIQRSLVSRLAKLSCQLSAGWQLGSCVRELNDKYQGNCLQHWNKVDCGGGTSHVRHSFEIIPAGQK